MAIGCRLALPRSQVQATSFLDQYVAEFYCHTAKLMVDVDGKQHEWLVEYDFGRKQALEAYGVRVIRFTNAEICQDLASGG